MDFLGLSTVNPIRDVEELIYRLGIVVLEDRDGFREPIEAMRSYSLLLGGALVAITARHRGIGVILTFDEDFKWVPWLKVAP